MLDLREFVRRLAPLTTKLKSASASASSSSSSNVIGELKALVGLVNERIVLEATPLPDRSAAKSGLRASVYFAPIDEATSYDTSVFGFRCVHDKIPLHNHPNMYGFLKAIRGSVLVSSFSLLEPNEESVLIRSKRSDYKCAGRIPVKCEGTLLLSANDRSEDSVAVLDPLKGNLHSVEALEEGSAFFDLLVPGYKNAACIYYAENGVHPVDGAIYWLKRIPEPKNFVTQRLQCEQMMSGF